MDHQSFDAFARAVAATTSRRRFVGLAAAIASAFAFGSRARAQDGTPTPEPPPTEISVVCGEACGDGLICDIASGCGDCCDGFCVNLNRDVFNCGACGVQCSETEACFGGVCEPVCDEGLTRCADGCVDLMSDVNNCGVCRNVCPEGTECLSGACGGVCPDGLTFCAQECVDLASDVANCGSCENNCPTDWVCSDGVCTEEGCAEGLSECDGACVDFSSDPFNCGGCGSACAADESCVDGVCESGCAEGSLLCDDVCIDPATDAANCGECGAACADDEACVDGVCESSGCGETDTLCGDTCVNLERNPSHCGACDKVCPDDKVCDNGACVDRDKVEVRVPDPSECVVTPRTQAELLAACDAAREKDKPTIDQDDWESVAAGLSENDIRIPKQEIADLQAVVDQVIACQNAGDLGRETALMTDAMAGRRLRPLRYCQPTVTLPAATALPWRFAGIASMVDVYTAGDDRRNALVTINEPGTRLVTTRLASFVRDGSTWKLDRFDVVDPGAGNGTVSLRFLDCAGKSAGDAACATGVMPYSAILRNPDQTYIAPISSASMVHPGEVQWYALPDDKYEIELAVGKNVALTALGASFQKSKTAWILETSIDRRNPSRLIDIYTNTDAKGTGDAYASVCGEGACPPCHVCDEWYGTCVPTCNYGEECDEIDGPAGYACTCKKHSDTLCYAERSWCQGDPDDACTVNEDCCYTPCIDGQCACLLEGEICQQDIDCCEPRRCVGGFCLTCAAYPGDSCESDEECCGSACVDNVCRCCFSCSTEDGVYTTAGAGLCCPLGAVCYPDTDAGAGFARCCTPGVDCLGDIDGPPAVYGANSFVVNTCWSQLA